MRTGTNTGIARVHLLSRKKQTLIAILGVMFGIAMFILMISFMKGTNGFLEEALLSSTPDIRIYQDTRSGQSEPAAARYYKEEEKLLLVLHHPKPAVRPRQLKEAEAMLDILRRDPAISEARPVITAQVFFMNGPVQLNGLVEGLEISAQSRLVKLAEKMVAGKTENIRRADNGILLGKGLAAKLGVGPGDWINLYSPKARMMRFRVEGLFQFGVGLVDNVKAFIHIRNAQQLLGEERGYITDIQLTLKDMQQARELAAGYTRRFGYTAEDWATANASVMATNIVRDVLTWVVSLALLIVAGFGIYNIMNMTIAGKLRDIAILKAQGFTGRDIVRIFLTQSLFIGMAGALAGLILGFGLSVFISRLPFPQSDLITLKYYPVVFELRFYLLGFLFGVITTFMAGLMPAVKASKLDPVAILRG